MNIIEPNILLASLIVTLALSNPAVASAQSEATSTFQVREGSSITANKIRLSAEEHGVNADLALNIACAESRFSSTAKNPTSTAGGVYQFLDSSWRAYGLKYWGSMEGRSKMDSDDNIDLAMKMLANTGTGDWNASKWSGYGGGWANDPYEKGYCV